MARLTSSEATSLELSEEAAETVDIGALASVSGKVETRPAQQVGQLLQVPYMSLSES